ncbi:hypothetical protein [Saccharopolyspora hattusasensis]|uniref:hypothetical protein n=1 Tax=Saccharopolyspora hattusasensis TaxID=1128679 RepID=UPI003D98F3D8
MNTERVCVLLSYDEPRADEHHQRLATVFGHVIRVHGVRGMRRAYRTCGERATTEEFFLADADLAIDPAFVPDSVSPLGVRAPMRVWRTRNPVNNLVYGYGGLKLCRRSAFRALPLAGGAADVLADLPGAPEFSREIAGDTAFDASPRHAWRAGFRECAMLTHGCDYGRITTDQAAEWLQAWTEIGRGPYGRWARQGAADGIAFARETGDDAAEWAQINDPHWLDARFTRLHATTEAAS